MKYPYMVYRTDVLVCLTHFSTVIINNGSNGMLINEYSSLIAPLYVKELSQGSISSIQVNLIPWPPCYTL